MPNPPSGLLIKSPAILTRHLGREVSILGQKDNTFFCSLYIPGHGIKAFFTPKSNILPLENASLLPLEDSQDHGIYHKPLALPEPQKKSFYITFPWCYEKLQPYYTIISAPDIKKALSHAQNLFNKSFHLSNASVPPEDKTHITLGDAVNLFLEHK